MKKIIAGLALIAAGYFVSAYNVHVQVSENTSSAACNGNDPGCGN